MKIFISLDMEGIPGTFSWEQEKNERSVVRKYMTQQISWVISGIQESECDAEVEEILIADSHSRGDNLLYDITSLDKRISIISGDPRPNYMMAGLDSSFDVAFLVGYHSGGGTLHGVMDHTYTSCFHKIMVQNKPMNEALMNGAYAGYYSVPVGLVIGDEALKQALMQKDAMPWVEYVTTKTGLGRFAAKHRPQEVIREETMAAVKKVLQKNLKEIPLYKFDAPIKLIIEFQTTVMADVAALIPGVKRLDGRTIEFINDDYRTLFNARQAIGALAVSVKG